MINIFWFPLVKNLPLNILLRIISKVIIVFKDRFQFVKIFAIMNKSKTYKNNYFMIGTVLNLY